MEPLGKSESAPQQKGCIVVIDDDPDLLQFHRIVLGNAGYRVECFFTASDASGFLEKEVPQLIITDLMMERLDAGFAFAASVKASPRLAGVPVILITAAESQRGFDFAPRGPEDLAAMCVDAYLAKPLSPSILLAKVQELLSR